MKSLTISAFVILLSLLCSCESFYEEQEILIEEEEVICLPVNMTATDIQGSETNQLSADFFYIPDTELLDHIKWSNRQTHLFKYNESNQLKSILQLKVDEKVMEEMWFTYDGSLVEKIDLVTRNLDPIYLDPLDSIHTGYIVFKYQGKLVTEESHYELIQGGITEELTWKVEYVYDYNGNIISSRAFDPRTNVMESVQLTYDTSKHPFSALQFYFNGESFINNYLSKSMLEEGFDYNYELILNEFGYPEEINEKLGATHSRTIHYTYISK